ncbi:lysozyme g-like isoform 3-T3 [Amazona ochrocephala]
MNPSCCMDLQHAVQYHPEILCVQTPVFNFSAPSMSYSCYGDISALQAPLVPCTAVRASDCGLALVRSSAEADIIRLRKYEIPIKRVARNLCLEPALIAGIISQESRVGLLLDNGWDQERHKYGLMQLGGHQQPFGLWDSEEHINQGSTILVLSINEVRARHPTWTWDQQLRDILPSGSTFFKVTSNHEHEERHAWADVTFAAGSQWEKPCCAWENAQQVVRHSCFP